MLLKHVGRFAKFSEAYGVCFVSSVKEHQMQMIRNVEVESLYEVISLRISLIWL
jgi:hypothetical protein